MAKSVVSVPDDLSDYFDEFIYETQNFELACVATGCGSSEYDLPLEKSVAEKCIEDFKAWLSKHIAESVLVVTAPGGGCKE